MLQLERFAAELEAESRACELLPKDGSVVEAAFSLLLEEQAVRQPDLPSAFLVINSYLAIRH